MKKTIVWILVVVSFIALILRYNEKLAEVIFGIKQKSGISVQSNPDGATVFLDGKEVGKTPFEDKNLEVKEYAIRIDKDDASFQGNVKLNDGTLTIVYRDLAKDRSSSAGEILSLKKGKGITIISNPSDADVEIDGKNLGKTPISLNLDSGDYNILISHSSYLKRSIKATLPKDFNLTISADLAISEADLTQISAPIVTQTPEVIVKSTPTGFLRVRDTASLNGKEIAQVKIGDTLILLEEQGSWDRVRLTNGVEGFVSSVYVQKKTQ